MQIICIRIFIFYFYVLPRFIIVFFMHIVACLWGSLFYHEVRWMTIDFIVQNSLPSALVFVGCKYAIFYALTTRDMILDFSRISPGCH